MKTRAGQYSHGIGGYKTFHPAPLPPTPPLNMDSELVNLLSEADRALGRLDGITYVLPNPDLFVAMYVRQEAVLSSQIEGTQSTLEDVLQFELDADTDNTPKDVEEVVNYIRAMKEGLRRLNELPLSLRLIREIHEILLYNVRGGTQKPGEFRTGQNWIGPAGCTIDTATFIPPDSTVMHQALNNFELFLHNHHLPALIHCGLAHAQFETIHPFMDGNGRVGRLLITLLLCEREVLHQPLLYLSHYLKSHRSEYYNHLMNIRHEGDWEGWLKFFLQGVLEVSLSASNTARAILDLRENHRQLVSKYKNAHIALDFLFLKPLVSINMIKNHLDCTYTTAKKIIEIFKEHNLLYEITGQKRNRLYRYDPYLALFKPSLKPHQSSLADRTEPQGYAIEP